MNLATALASTVLILATGCATGTATLPPIESDKVVALWLHAAPRALALRVDPILPAPLVRNTDHKTGRRVAGSAAGGLLGFAAPIAAGCTGGPIGCLFGGMVAPFSGIGFAVAGAAGPRSTESYGAPTQIEGAQALWDAAVVPAELAPGLARALLSAAKDRRHRLIVVDEAVPPAPSLAVRVRAISLLPSDDADGTPSLALALTLEMRTAMTSGNAAEEAIYYEGRGRTVAQWGANDARLFREEVQRAIDETAKSAINELHARPDLRAHRK